MPNTQSAKKAVRGSLRKKSHNLFWKRRIKDTIKEIKEALKVKKPDVSSLNQEIVKLQKYLDKAAKEKVIHKNKANRLKSRYATKVTALSKETNSKSVKADK